MGLPLQTRLLHEYLRFLKVYHRVSTQGTEHLLAPGAKLVTGYHGRGLPMDMGILAFDVYERSGYLPHVIMHAAMWKIPIFRSFIEKWGAIPGDCPALAAAFEKGENVFVAPGGALEGCRSFRKRYTVDWGRHRGYLRIAMKYNVPIVPVASAGVDDRFFGLNDGHALGKRLGMPAGVPLWIGVGVGGVFPLALPLPSRIHTVIGAPIDLHAVRGARPPADPATLEFLHAVVTESVQTLLHAARAATT